MFDFVKNKFYVDPTHRCVMGWPNGSSPWGHAIDMSVEHRIYYLSFCEDSTAFCLEFESQDKIECYFKLMQRLLRKLY